MKMRGLLFCSTLMTLAYGAIGLQAAILLRFDAATYNPGTDEAFVVRILIDGNDRTVGDQPVPNGLFSFGLRLEFPAASAAIEAGGARVVPELNYTGLVPGAVVEQGVGFLSVRGNVSSDSGSPGAYGGSLLLTVTFRNRAPLDSRYALTLTSGRSQDSGAVMIDGVGTVFDTALAFGRAEVVVTPQAPPAPPRLAIRQLEADRVELTYAPTPGLDHFVQSSTNARNWTDLFPVARNEGLVLLKATGPAQYIRLRTAPISP